LAFSRRRVFDRAYQKISDSRIHQVEKDYHCRCIQSPKESRRKEAKTAIKKEHAAVTYTMNNGLFRTDLHHNNYQFNISQGDI
jgi:hypothetical protein